MKSVIEVLFIYSNEELLVLTNLKLKENNSKRFS